MNRILSLFGIGPTQKKDFLLICTPFAAAVILILFATATLCLYSLTEIDNKVNTLQNLFITIITVISNLLVVVNTFIFAFVSPQITVREPNKSVTEKPKKTSSFCNLLNLITFGVAFILLGRVLFFDNSIYLISILSIIIFSLFIAADKLFIIHLDECIYREKDQHSLANFNVKKSVMKRAIALIDFAGLIGSLIIFIMSLMFLAFADNNFIQGFGIGALAFHIIFTQFNWAYLKTDELRKLALI